MGAEAPPGHPSGAPEVIAGAAQPEAAGAPSAAAEKQPGEEFGVRRQAVPGESVPLEGGAAASRPLAEGGEAVASVRPESREFRPTGGLRDVFFEFDRYDLRPDDAKILDEDVEWLRSNPNYLVLIEGHCDERGTNEYNLALGDHRARATRNYIVANGIAANRITTFSWGEERPFCAERTEDCWVQNRRAHFLIKPGSLR